MPTVRVLVAVAAFVCGIAEALGKCPGWVVDILLSICLLLMLLPQ